MKTKHYNLISILLMVITTIGWIIFGIGEINIAIPLTLNSIQIGWLLAIIYVAIKDKA